MFSGLRRIVSVDWKLSARPSFCCEIDSYLDNGCRVSVGLVGVDMPDGIGVGFWVSFPDEDSPGVRDIL